MSSFEPDPLADGTADGSNWLTVIALLLSFLFVFLLRRAKSHRPVAVKEPAVEKFESQLSPAELARILGNSLPGDYDDGPPGDELLTKSKKSPSPDAAKAAEALDASRIARKAADAPDTALASVPETEPAEEEVVTEGAAAAVTEAGEALIEALQGSDCALAVRLVRGATPAVVNYVDSSDQNALLVGAMEGHFEACRWLLARQDFTGVNIRNHIGSTALHLAAANDQVEICRALIACPRYTLGVNAENMNGQTPLDFSLDFGEGVCAEVLKSAGAQRNGSGNLVHRRKKRECIEPDGDDHWRPDTKEMNRLD